MSLYDDYQDKWHGGKTVSKGLRDCSQRYEFLRPLFDRYKRKFSLLDIGANAGYFSLRAKDEYKCFPVLIEPEPIAREAKLPLIPNFVAGHSLVEAAKSDHFDIVLCLSVLHHVAADWRTFLQGVLAMGQHIVLEVPGPADGKYFTRGYTREQYEFLEGMEKELLGYTPSFDSKTDVRPMWLFTNPRDRISNRSFYCHRKLFRLTNEKSYELICNYYVKGLVKRPSSVWIHGINLFNYKTLGGDVGSIAPEKPPFYHGDVRPWNYVLNHQGCYLIDWSDPKKYRESDEKSWHEVLTWLQGGVPLS